VENVFECDIDKHKPAEEKLRETKNLVVDASKGKAGLLANMSHELRSPLNSIIGFSQVLADQYFGPLNDKQSIYVGNIEKAGKQLLSLISDVIDLSKTDAGKEKIELSSFNLSLLLKPYKPAVILVVDDEEPNRSLLNAMLAPEGYEIISAIDGVDALDKVYKNKPDVVLLDVMMPGLSGFDICKTIKSNPVTAPIAVLLVTSLHQRENRLGGMMAGANDFVTKPIDKEDLLLRVRNAAHTKRLYDEMQFQFEKLKALELLRDNLTHMIVHDLRSPLTGVSGYLQLIPKDSMEQKYAGYLEKSLAVVATLSGMIDTLLDVSRFEEGKMPVVKQQCDIKTLVNEAIETLGALTDKSNYKFDVPSEPVIIGCDAGIIVRVLANLLVNAVRYSSGNKEIVIKIEDENENIKISITDKGYGIAPEFHQKIFEKFGQVEMHKQKQTHSTGLGLTFCKLAVEAHGGKIGVISESEKGSTFWFTLPATKQS